MKPLGFAKKIQTQCRPSYAFENCYSLDNLFIPENVKKVGENIFLKNIGNGVNLVYLVIEKQNIN